MVEGYLGAISTPHQGMKQIPEGVRWVADNGCFGSDYKGDDYWFRWLTEHPNKELCVAASAPDVVGDAEATWERSAPWLPKIRELGLPACLVAQDGVEYMDVAWDEFDALFLGGTTAWKIGPRARRITAEAKARGKWVHMGRVNTRTRLRTAASFGCDSVDGTILAFGPDKNLQILLGQLAELNDRSVHAG